MDNSVESEPPLVATGVAGVDDILHGGFPAECLYMLSGEPGSGKTTLAMQFLLEGARHGESCLYITLSESRREIQKVAKSHGWDLSGVEICELIPSENNLAADAQLTVFSPSELELGETTQAMIGAVNKFNPKRVVLDSLSEMRLVAQNSLRYRRQILALKHFFAGRNCTVLMLDDCTGDSADGQLESIAHGVISLEQLANQYGAERRRLRVNKLRGAAYRGGFHDFVIRKGGLDVFPRLIAAEHHDEFLDEELPSGNAELDALLCGGIPVGTSTLLIGPAGTGKSTITTLFAASAAARGQRISMYVFDENIGVLRSRSRKLGIPVESALRNDMLAIEQIDPAELSSGEFAARVRRAVDGSAGQQPAKMIIIDSLNGYLNAMPEERFLTAQLHELLSYLGQKGVVTLLTVTQSGMVGANMHTPVDTTYLADNVILFRYFEAQGHVRRAISVIKKRNGRHEQTIRELHINESGIQIGDPLEDFQGVLSGLPHYTGSADKLAQQSRNRQ